MSDYNLKLEEVWKMFQDRYPLDTRYCARKGKITTLINLSCEECKACRDFINNGGMCDPL